MLGAGMRSGKVVRKIGMNGGGKQCGRKKQAFSDGSQAFRQLLRQLPTSFQRQARASHAANDKLPAVGPFTALHSAS